MMDPTDWNGELIADLASQGSGLGEAQMMGVGGRSTADQARLPRHVLAMVLVAHPDGLGRNSAAGRSGFVCRSRRLARWDALTLLGRLSIHQVQVGLGSIVSGSASSKAASLAWKLDSTSFASGAVRVFFVGRL